MNTVELIGTYGGDRTHAASAWTSTERVEHAPPERIAALLDLLASSDPPHTSPFEKSYIHFLVRLDNASHIHMLKHRIGVSINGQSARYKEYREPSHYVPPDWPEHWQALLDDHAAESERLYSTAVAALEPVLGRKRAKETARYFLTNANQLTLDVGFNWSSFAHFLSLRRHADAQREINEIADAMLTLVKAVGDFDLTIKAYGL